MKKNVALFVSMALVLAVAAPGRAARGPAQKPAAKDAVETPFPSRVGERARYAMTMAQKDDAGEPKVTTDVTVENLPGGRVRILDHVDIWEVPPRSSRRGGRLRRTKARGSHAQRGPAAPT